MKFFDITIVQTISTILLKAYAPDFTHQLPLLIPTPTTFPSDAVYFRAIVSNPPPFNLCFNTFILHIKAPSFRQLGFLVHCCKGLNPVHWFQFADYAAVISGQESEDQFAQSLHYLVQVGTHGHSS